MSCTARIATTITDTPAAAAAATAAATATPVPTRTVTPVATPSPISVAASGAVRTAPEASTGPQPANVLMLGAAVVLVGALSALLYRRFARHR